MPVLLAAAPLLAVLAALLLRQSALRASILGVAVAAVIAVAAFDTTPGELAVATWAWRCRTMRWITWSRISPAWDAILATSN